MTINYYEDNKYVNQENINILKNKIIKNIQFIDDTNLKIIFTDNTSLEIDVFVDEDGVWELEIDYFTK